jgi:hypothetical protein
MVRLAPVMLSGEADHPPPRLCSGGSDGPRSGWAPGSVGQVRGRVGIRRCRVTACVAPLSGHRRARWVGLPRRAGRSSLSPGGVPHGTHARCQGPKIAEIMIAAGPTLTNSSATPIFNDGMTSFRRVRPDDFPILERTGHPFPTRLFSCPPARAPIGPARQRRAAHRSSGLDDQAHADRCHARGGNPRRRTGW